MRNLYITNPPFFFYIHVQHYMYIKVLKLNIAQHMNKNYLFIIRRFPKNHSCGSRLFFFYLKITKSQKPGFVFFFFLHHSLLKWYILVISIAGGKTFMWPINLPLQSLIIPVQSRTVIDIFIYGNQMTIVSLFMTGIFVACFSIVNNVIFSSKTQNVCKCMYINNTDTTLMFLLLRQLCCTW